ncbi:MAG: EpsG family protein [Muribaculaceae bacterium]|nr:EpsG family protein [Muribaculaceae bacterium]
MTQSEYKLIYYLILGGALLICLLFRQDKNDKYGNFPFCLLIILLVAYLVGNRGDTIGSDTANYRNWFYEYSNMSIGEILTGLAYGGDPIFKIGLFWVGQVMDYNGMLWVVSLTISFTYYCVARNIIRATGQGSIVLLFLTMMAMSVTWNSQINIMRFGVASGFFLLFLLALYENKITKSIIFGILAAGSHFSAGIFIVIALIPKFLNLKLNYYCVIYIVCLFASILGVSVLDFGWFRNIEFAKVDFYISSNAEYQVGFRPLFALYNTGFLIIAVYLKKYFNVMLMKILKYYILASSLFFLWFSIPFSDRMGAFSWIVIPALYYIPFASKFRHHYVSIIAIVVFGIFNSIIG